MSEDILKNKRIELMAEFLKDGGQWEKKSKKLFEDILKNTEAYKKRGAVKASDEYFMIVALSEMFVKLQTMGVIQTRLLEKTLDILAEHIEGDTWKNTMKEVSKLQLGDVISLDKDGA